MRVPKREREGAEMSDAPQTIQPVMQSVADDWREREKLREGEMPCPVCGHPMPDLKGGKATICPVCGFKDSCCY
jgi:hypothetical protein